MTKTKVIQFADMRLLLSNVGYRENRLANAHVFHREKNERVIFRRYRDDEPLDMGDVSSTRRFLDMRGILDEAEFDSFFDSINKSA